MSSGIIIISNWHEANLRNMLDIKDTMVWCFKMAQNRCCTCTVVINFILWIMLSVLKKTGLYLQCRWLATDRFNVNSSIKGNTLQNYNYKNLIIVQQQINFSVQFHDEQNNFILKNHLNKSSTYNSSPFHFFKFPLFQIGERTINIRKSCALYLDGVLLYSWSDLTRIVVIIIH